MNHRLVATLFCLLLLACNQTPVEFRNTDLTGATFGRQLMLSDHNGRNRSIGDFRDKVILIFFGYTSCPDICPTTLARLAEVMKELGSEAERVQVLFVSLDPERDTKKRLKEFVPWFHPSFPGLYGDAAQTKAVSEEFRVFSSRKEVGSQMRYVLDHSSGAYVYDPAGRLRLYVRDSVGVDDFASDIRQLFAGQ